MRTRSLITVLIVLTITCIRPAFAGTIGQTGVAPTSTPAGIPQVVTVTSQITDPSLIPGSVNLQKLDSQGRVLVVLGTLHDDGMNGDAVAGDHIFTLQTTIYENNPGSVILRVSAGFSGQLKRSYSAPIYVNVTGTAAGISISSPADGTYTNTSPATVTGTVGDPAAQVTLNGISAPVSNKNFVVTVPLREGPNTITAVAQNTNSTTSTSSILVTLDTTPPHVAIYTPVDQATTTASTVTVTGLVNDIVVGTVNNQQATVSVNGAPATVANRSFSLANVPLSLGPNAIQAVATDRAGNSATTSVTITRQAITQSTLLVSSGDGQAGPILTQLSKPLVAQLVNAQGKPIPNTSVIFVVKSQNGTLSSGNKSGLGSISVNTNAGGLASVNFTLGSHSGAGNNTVEASVVGVTTTAVFTATANPAPAGLIVVDTGNNQSGVINQPLPLPFIAIVTDKGYNRLPGVPVTFTVKKGAGNFAGKTSFTTQSDSDGRVMATLTLDPNPGVSNNLVEATFPGNSGQPAAFTASGLSPGLPALTQISGVVLDNSNNPIQGVTMHLYQVNSGSNSNLPVEVAKAVQTDAEGQFVMLPVPVGVFKLMADGGTAQPIGSYPTLEYDIVTVVGANNTVGLPIYLPRLDSAGKLCVDDNNGGTLTIPQVPGFALKIAPGSATFPGGSRSGCVTVSAVNMDKVPMAPGFGQQPRFIVTIQPVGTIFNPPAPMTIPNVDGLPPRAVTEMYSYDHDLAAFVSIGTGTVSNDGSVIASDPGVGVLKAGWHCGGNPNSSGNAASLGVTISPTMATVEMNKTVSFTASGTPPLDGTYSWEIIATQAGDDIGVVTLTSQPACPDQSSCTAQLQGVKPGQVTLRVHFICTTTNLEVTADARIQVTTADVVVIAWVDSSAISLPTGESLLLYADLHTPVACELLLLSWDNGLPIDLFSNADVDYANSYLLQNSGNHKPPQTIDPSASLAGGDFRLFNRFQAFFTASGGPISNLMPIQNTAQVGTTPDPCPLSVIPNAAGETHASNGATGVGSSGLDVYQLAEGRLGQHGQNINMTLNGHTTPWIWSVIKFDPLGNPDTASDHAIFPTYYVYQDGNLISIYPQSNPATFISLDNTYQRLPSQIQ